jgi:hypothetical protein
MQQQWKDAYPGIVGKLLTAAMLFVGRDPEQGSYSALYVNLSVQYSLSLNQIGSFLILELILNLTNAFCGSKVRRDESRS